LNLDLVDPALRAVDLRLRCLEIFDARAGCDQAFGRGLLHLARLRLRHFGAARAVFQLIQLMLQGVAQGDRAFQLGVGVVDVDLRGGPGLRQRVHALGVLLSLFHGDLLHREARLRRAHFLGP